MSAKTIPFLLFILLLTFSAPAQAEDEDTPGYTDKIMKMLSEPEADKDVAITPYLLRMGDRVRVSVFGFEELSGTFQVDSNGLISMTLLGDVQASGLSTRELQESIANRLIDGEYYNDPKVTVEIIALKPFYILGEVDEPGSYEYEPDLDVFKAIAIAGGYTPRAIKNDVIIIRTMHEEKVEIKATEKTPVLPGDSIKVKQRFF